MSNNDGPRRDPRRLFTNNQRNHIASRQHQNCHDCGNVLPEPFHIHHIVPWAEGGLTDEDNGIAVCPNCHRNSATRKIAAFEPREWQIAALPKVLPQLQSREFATVSAAPGAGKTLFAAWIYRQLCDAGDVSRVVVFVPNANLRGQWADEAKLLNVFLQTKGTTEKRSYDGVVLTYHSLSDAQQVEQIIADAAEYPTLFILDEVHHLAQDRGGSAGAWAVNIGRIVGSYDHPSHAVLNLSGTLFRSKKNEQISTIKYQYISDEDGQIETVADYVKSAGELVSERQLRHIKVLGFDADMRVNAIDVGKEATEGAVTCRAVDIDADKCLRGRVLGGMIRDARYIDGIIGETVNRLGHASTALNGAPVKGLVIADGVEHSEQIYASLVESVGQRHAFIAHGQMSSAESEITRFRKSEDQAVMVAVQKVTEGFDVPDICVLTYLRTWRAPLFINQMCGRAMRITKRERELGTILPATILLPNETGVKSAFADVLVGAMNVMAAPPEPCPSCGQDVCACPPRPREKICRRCNFPWYLCTCICGKCGLSRYTGCFCRRGPGDPPPGEPCIDLEVVSDGEVVHVSIDGNDIDLHIINGVREASSSAGIPDVFVEQVAAAMQNAMRKDPMTFLTALRGTEK